MTRLRAVASAGAPISTKALRAMRPHFVNAEIHTPYGMTEVMPVTNISLEEIDAQARATASASEHRSAGWSWP